MNKNINIISNLNKKIKNCAKAVFAMFLLFSVAFVASACGNIYDKMEIVLSNKGANVILYLGDTPEKATETVTASIDGDNSISREIIVSSENDKVAISTKFNSDKTTTITLTAVGVCKDAPITVQSKEGGKKTTFYVSVEIPIQSMIETTNSNELFVVKGQTKSLIANKLINITPVNTTQKDCTFAIFGTTPEGVVLDGNNLFVPENFSARTIQVLATSKSNISMQTVITLNVIDKITDNINFQAFYKGTATEIDLSKTIEIAKNVNEKNSVDFKISLLSFDNLNITPYILSTLTQTSKFASITSYSKTTQNNIISYAFTISSETENGTDAFYFDIAYADYNYSVQTAPFNFETFDAVTQLAVSIDGQTVSGNQLNLDVYDKYYGRAGMEVLASVFPTTVPITEKGLVLKLGTNATNYTFKKQNINGSVENIVFVDNQYELQSGEKFFVQANSAASGNAVFTLTSKSNPQIFKQFNLSSKQGASNLSFLDAVVVNELNYYYLTTNNTFRTQVSFAVNNTALADISVVASGESFVLASDVKHGAEIGTYYILLESVQNAPDETGVLTIKLGNGLFASAHIESFAQLDKNSIKLNVPSAQYDASIGHKSALDDVSVNGTNFNLEFFVAVHNGEATNLTLTANASFKSSFTFYDKLLADASAYNDDYVAFNTFSQQGGMADINNYLTTSSVVRSLYLNSFGSINATTVGKTWVRATIEGWALIDGRKEVQTYDFYFLVESYNPVKSFSLSRSAISLYALNSVGDANKTDTFADLSININADATYNQISWINNFSTYDPETGMMTYSLKDEGIFNFIIGQNGNLHLEAFSTLYSYQENGETYFAYAKSLVFDFIAQYTEFGIKHPINLRATIKKAEQVKNIVVDNLNIENGIYLELGYANENITYPILAHADNGVNNAAPLNPNLIFTFLPDGTTPSNILTIDSKTGLISINKNQQIGGTGVIRIAPADRFVNSVYVPGNTDIAVYIKITIADGRNRETSYRISSVSEITNPNLHYTLLTSASTLLNTENDFAIFNEFDGGLYGALKGSTQISTITTNKTLFGTLTANAIVEDLIIVGDLTGSLGGFVANINYGKIINVTIDTQASGGVYLPSTLTLSPADLAAKNIVYVGGLVGQNFGSLTHSHFFGAINASGAIVGGLVGQNNASISFSTVEFYNFPAGYSALVGGAFVGGLIGEMQSGSLFESYAYSYVSTGDENKNYINLNILTANGNGTAGAAGVGGLVGKLAGGNVDKSFAQINDVSALFGEVDNTHADGTENAISVNNAYIIYRISNSAFNAVYYYNGAQIANPNTIVSNEIWRAAEAGVNYGYPYFVNMLPTQAAQIVGNSLANTSTIISVDGQSVIFNFNTNQTLSKQEQTALTLLNTISFEKLLGMQNVSGIRALSSNPSVINTYSNGIIINGLGTCTLTLISKYDFSISKTFTVFVVNPITNFVLNFNETEFSNGASITSKITDNLAIYGKTSTSILLVNRNVLLHTDSLKLNFVSFENYISGSGLGGYVINTQKLYANTGLTEAEIAYNLGIAELSKNFVSATLNEDLLAINTILNNHFAGHFNLKLFKGADKIEITPKATTIEPSDILNFEVNIFGDVDYRESQTGEALALNIVAKTTGEALEIIAFEITDAGKITTYKIGLNDTVMFEVVVVHTASVYYLSTTNLTLQTQNKSEAVYYQHKFDVRLEVANEYKNHGFNGSEFNVNLFATTSQNNNTEHNGDLVSETFELTIKSQSVLSLDATHYALSGKVLRVVDGQNVTFNQYSPQANSVLTPGDEGMLAVDVFPVYSSYQSLEVTYETLNKDALDMRLALLEKQPDGSFIRSTKGFTSLENGVRIYNNFDANFVSSLSSLYLSTFIPESVQKDAIFVLKITAYDATGAQVGVSVKFNLVVQYLKGASLAIVNENGEDVRTLVRGGTETILITVDKEQSLGSLTIKGYQQTPDANNFVSYSKFTEIIDNAKNTKTYKAVLYVGTGIVLENNCNYLTFEAGVDWVVNGKIQTKTTSLNVGVVDFDINSATLKTDKLDKTQYSAYIGVQSALNFEFDVRDYLTASQGSNPALQQFLQNGYYKAASGLSVYGDYVVNYGFADAQNLMGNLFYVNGDTHQQVLNANGSFSQNNYFNFETEGNVIKVTGKRVGAVPMMLSIPVKYPSFNQNVVRNINFYFTISVEVYSDEDTPLIIDDEQAFLDALNAAEPQNYILMNNLYLSDYTPQNTTGIASLDGNNYTINILSYNTATNETYLPIALFNTISSASTIKNLMVNTYHASGIAIDTTRFNSFDVAGFAIRNEGIVYNCSVVAFESDSSRPNIAVPQGINVSYSMGQINESKTSRIAGFVLENKGSITNSRVGGKTAEFAIGGSKQLDAFNIVGQGDIAGFVWNNSGSIASSFVANATLTNNTLSGTPTFTGGFVGNNSGSVQLSYVEGLGNSNSYSLATAGISTSSVSAGFVYSNNSYGTIGDCYANILLATTNAATQQQYSSGRLTSGFVYINEGAVARSYTASKIENAKTTQMNFIGVDSYGEMQNKGAGTIKNCYYYNLYSELDDAYAGTTDAINVARVTEPDLATNFYGFSFASTATSLNGVWFINSTGPKLVSANQIAVSSRYIADAKRDAQTGELISYKLPYHDGYQYGSVNNPIIIRTAAEFNLVFGGDPLNAGTAISAYYDLLSSRVFGNYRIVTNLNLAQLITDTTSGVKINSSNMSLYGGKIDGNMFTLEGLELVAKIDGITAKDYGMFAKLENNAIIMNLKIEVIAVNAVTMQNVGTVAGTVENSKLVNITLYSGNSEGAADVVGNNIVGGVVGKVVGESELKNIATNNLDIIANNVAPGQTQRFNRDETLNNRVNANTSYAGGIAGVADIYKVNGRADLSHNNRLGNATLGFLSVKGNMQISGSTAGGIVAYLGPQTLMKDVTFELSSEKTQKLIAYNFSAGGIVGECYGDIDMARAGHELALQHTIENSVASYYANPSASGVERGNVTLFQHNEQGKYQPQNIGGIVGELITGNISHSFSKLNVRNALAVNAGGVIGKVSFASNDVINNINIYEVYTFSDVYAANAVGGFAGYIDQTRTLSFDKVNMVNYWSLAYNDATSSYYLPSYFYDVYATTGTRNIEPKQLSEIVADTGTSVSIKPGFSRYSLPVIAQEIHSDDVYAMNFVDYSFSGSQQRAQLKNSYASIGSNIYFKIIDTDTQAITPLKTYVNAQISGSEMDAYFRNSDWDPNFWRRYQTDMLPRLVSNADVNIFYIYVAEDLQNMVNYPDATFIVVGQNENGIVPVGNYIRSTGLFIDNFSGVLRGYDNSGAYGFDFEGYSLTFINSTTSGAKIYNLTIKNLGSSASQYLEGEGSFVGSAVGTNLENLTFKNCALYALATTDFNNIGLLSGHITGGFVSNICFEDCSVDVLVDVNLTELNVGMMAGLITTPTNAYMQISDITAYITGTNTNTGTANRVNVNTNGYTIGTLNTGAIAGSTDGSVLLYYTSKSSVDGQIKHVGVSDTASIVFTPDSDSAVEKGLILDVRGNGTVKNFNAGLGFGMSNVLNLSYQRSASELKFVGAIKNSGTAVIENAALGGYIGKSLTSSIITNGSGSVGNYMYVDCDINLIAGSVAAGMLIGESSKIYALENVDTYGTIKVLSQNAASFVGGIVGKANSDTSIGYCISRTAIIFNDTKSDYSAIGGLVGFFANPSSKVVIGKDNFKTQYLGTITLATNNVFAGGIVGSFATTNSGSLSELAGVEIVSAVFGGNIVVNNAKEAFVGGIIGASNYNNRSVEAAKIIDTCFAYGNITINADFTSNTNPTYVGGIVGKGSALTQVNQNFAVSTIYSKHTQTQTKLNVNAVVGLANGAYAGTDSIAGLVLKNYYSHQLSLCLDSSGVQSENIYYQTKNTGTDKTMLSVLQIYINSLSEKDKLSLAYEGSKLNPFVIDNQTYTKNSYYFNHNIPNTKGNPVKYFVISDDIAENTFRGAELENAFVVGDGFSITNTSGAAFAKIDATSTVSGMAIKAQISTPNSTYHAQDGTAYHGVGTLADINVGYVYSCNTNEIQNAKQHAVFGLNSSASGVYAGGLIGVNLGYVSDCYSSIDLYSNGVAGGFAGLNLGTISHSYSNGTIQSLDSDSFAESVRGGSVYYCYAVSTVVSGVASVFAADTASTIASCFYDIYSTGVKSATAIQLTTDEMAVYDSDNKLAKPELNQPNEESGEEIPRNFLANTEKPDDSAIIKFGYKFDFNNGYPTFIGSAYKLLTYMQDCYTGNGINAENAIEIPNIGKLQQIDDMKSTSGLNFALTADISLTNDMKAATNADKNINTWRAIGQPSSNGGAFKGNLNGSHNSASSVGSVNYAASSTAAKFASNSVVNAAGNSAINAGNSSSNWARSSMGNEMLNSEVNVTPNSAVAARNSINTGSFTRNTATNSISNSAGNFAANTVAISTFGAANNFANNSSGNFAANTAANYAGNARAASGGENYVISNLNFAGAEDYAGLFAETQNASILNIVLKFNTVENGQQTNALSIGAVAGKANSTTIKNISVENALFNFGGSGEAYIGGLVGLASGATTIEACTITTLNLQNSGTGAGGTTSIGGVAGAATSGAVLIKDVEIKNSATFLYKAGGTNYIGGVVGNISGTSTRVVKVENCTIPSTAKFNVVASTTGGTNYIGALSGQAVFADFKNINLESGYEFNIKSNATIYNGALVGRSENSAYDAVAIGNNYTLTSTTSGDAYVGAMFGEVVATDVELNLSNISIPNNNTIQVLGTGSAQNAEVYMGGLVGKSTGVSFSDVDFGSLSSNTLKFTSGGTGYVGGLAGWIEGNTNISGISLNFGGGQLEANTTGTFIFGGVAGKVGGNASINNASIFYASSTFATSAGNIGTAKIGGVVGLLDNSAITGNCSSSGLDFSNLTFKKAYVGGIVAETEGTSTISGANTQSLNFNNARATDIYVGGIVANISGNTGVNGCQAGGMTFNQLTATNEAYIAGVASYIDNDARVENCDVNNLTFTNMNLSKACISGIVASAKGNSQVVNCNLNTFKILDIITQNPNFAGIVAEVAGSPTINAVNASNIEIAVKNVNETNIGGIVAKVDAISTSGGFEITNSKVDNVKITVDEATKVFAGGLAGQISGVNFTNCEVSKLNISVINQTSSSSKNQIGGIVGKASSTQILGGKVSEFKCFYNGKASINLGGFIGEADNTKIDASPAGNSVVSKSVLINAAETVESGGMTTLSTVNNLAQVGGVVGLSQAGVKIYNINVENTNVINGSGNKDEILYGAGGITAFSNSEENEFKNIKTTAVAVGAYHLAGGVVAGGAGIFDNISTSRTVRAGHDGQDLRTSEFSAVANFLNKETPIAGGIIGWCTGGSITNCENKATVQAGYGKRVTQIEFNPDQLKNWGVDHHDTIVAEHNASASSYAAGIAAQASGNLIIDKCSNYAQIFALAKQEMYTQTSVVYDTAFWGGHKIFSSFFHDEAHANGIAYISKNSAVMVSNCFNQADITGGATIGVNWVWNSPYTVDDWFFEGDVKFFMLSYGMRQGASDGRNGLFNTFYYLYGRNAQVRTELMQLFKSHSGGPALFGVSQEEGQLGKNINLYYANVICNNPNVQTGSYYKYKFLLDYNINTNVSNNKYDPAYKTTTSFNSVNDFLIFSDGGQPKNSSLSFFEDLGLAGILEGFGWLTGIGAPAYREDISVIPLTHYNEELWGGVSPGNKPY